MVALGVMLLTYIWRFHGIFPVLTKVYLVTLASLAAYGLYVVDRDHRRRWQEIKHPVTTLMFAVLALAVLSVPTSLWPGGSFAFLYGDYIKTFTLGLLLAATVRAFTDVRRLAGIQVFGAAVYSFMVLWSYGLGGGRAGGVGGGMHDANDSAMLLVGIFPLAVYFVARARTFVRRVLAVVVILLLIAAITRSGSRAGFLGFLAVSCYLILAFRALPKKIRFGAAVISVLGVLLVASDEYWERMSTLLDPTQDYNWAGRSNQGRIEIWKRGVGYMLQYPLFGVGVSRFSTAEGRLSPMADGPAGRGFRWNSPHNSFVEIGAELGIPGLLVFLALLGCAFRTLRRISRVQRVRGPPNADRSAMAQALTGSLIAYVVIGFFLSQAYSAFIYSLLGMIVGLAKVAEAAPGQKRAGVVGQRSGRSQRRGGRPLGRRSNAPIASGPIRYTHGPSTS